MPFIICIPLNENTSLITGVPPYRASNNTEKYFINKKIYTNLSNIKSIYNSCFGLAFDEAAEKTKSRVNFSFFDTSSNKIYFKNTFFLLVSFIVLTFLSN